MSNNPNNQRTIVIYHRADFDGIFCREIARKFLPGAELIGWDHGDPKIPFPTEGTVYVLDLSPECFVSVPDIEEVAKRMVWIDHHKSAIEKWPGTSLPGLRIDGVAACRLAWQWFTHDTACLQPKEHYVDRAVSEPYAVQLAGEYDVWDKRNPDAEVFQFGLRSQDVTDRQWDQLLEPYMGNAFVNRLLVNGRLLQRYQREMDAGVMHRSFLVDFEGLKFLALNTARCNSLTFASRDIPETGHDALMGFYWNGSAWNISLYHANHRKDLDLSEIAVQNGGGGHRGACGFRATHLAFLAPNVSIT
jgi:uncharacterized protein